LVKRRNPLWTFTAVIIAGGGLFTVLIWGNYRYAQKNPGGTDFLVHWVGTRGFITNGTSPYSDQAALNIQTMVYGRAAKVGEHQLRVAYPLYSILLFLPFALIKDYVMARAFWMAVLEVALIGLAFLSLRLVRWKPKPIILGIFILFSVFWYHAFRPLILGNAVILIAVAIVAVVLAIRSKQDELAGVLLAFSTIKPQVVILFIGYIVFWSIFKRRWKILAWLAITLAILTGIGILLIPDWIVQNLREILRYPGYNPPGTVSAALAALMPNIGKRLGFIIPILVGLVTLVEWIISLKSDFRGFVWTTCLTLTASLWIGIQTDPGNFIVAFPALVLAFAMWVERWRTAGAILSIISMAAIFVGIWALFLKTVEYTYQPVQSPVMFFPLPLIAFILLYWVRWWAIKPPQVWFELLAEENRTND
jgi:hypothetical protein